MKKILSVLLFYPFLCSAEILELKIDDCNGSLINTLSIPFPLLENDIVGISGTNIKLNIKLIENIDEDYRLKINLSRINKKGSEINIVTELLISKNKKTPLGGYCSNQDNQGEKGEKYFLTVR